RTMPGDFSLARSPVTPFGTLAVPKATQSANTVYAGPTSGGAVVPTFRALVAADYPAFVAAGASHARGAVPDPGATAHSNFPYFLGDDAAFHPIKGEILGSKYVDTDESTSSNVMGHLTTHDEVTFTLDVAADVVIMYLASAYN